MPDEPNAPPARRGTDESGAAGAAGETVESSGAGGRGEAGAGRGGRGGSATGGGGGGRGGGGNGGSSLGGRSLGGKGGASGGTTGAAGSAGVAGGPGDARALWFSEYVEGSSNNKALELRAVAATSLEGCHVTIYSNGNTKGSDVALSGELATGDAYVLCSSSLATLLGPTCDATLNLTFNGNDAVVLDCEGTVVDAIGQLGFDPKAAWSAAGVSTVDQTLRRRCGVTQGDPIATDPFDPSVEWAAHSTDDFSGLGVADCD